MRTVTIGVIPFALLAIPAAAQMPSYTTIVAKNRASAAPMPPVELPGVTIVAKDKEFFPPTPRPKQEGLRLMPPIEYDRPYSGPGKLLITYAESQGEVRDQCPGAVWPKAGAFGCSMNKTWGCHVVIAPDADAKRVGLTKDILLRHEIAHCNGWPGDHRGALPILDWALMDAPEDAIKTSLQPSAQQQPASRPCGIAIQKPCEQ